MAKITKKYGFSKAELSKDENGRYIVTEISKDDSTDYDLSSVLDSFVGESGITISIGMDNEVPEIEN